jgi:hypothetical protein
VSFEHRVRSAAYLSALAHARQRFGEDAVAQVVAGLSDADREIVAAQTDAEAWGSFSTWIRLIEALDNELGEGDLGVAREGGRWAAMTDLTRRFPEMARTGTPEELVVLASRFWRSYYDGGRAEAVAAHEADAALFEVIDFPEPNLVHCNRVLGWIGGAFAFIGIEVEMTMPSCRARGDERCIYIARGPALAARR